jgi:nucleotide-binding universal stress UspA family protein
MSYIHTILHATDLSETSQAAFKLACALARDYQAELIVLHVYPLPINGADEVDRERDDDMEKDLLAALHKLTPPEPNIRISYRVEEGLPVEVILEVAQGCDMIVMGTHGRGGIGRALMGSVAEQVLREATCPVVTVRATVAIPDEAGAGATNSVPGLRMNADLVSGC